MLTIYMAACSLTCRACATRLISLMISSRIEYHCSSPRRPAWQPYRPLTPQALHCRDRSAHRVLWWLQLQAYVPAPLGPSSGVAVGRGVLSVPGLVERLALILD